VKKVVEYPVHENHLGWLTGICFDSNGTAYAISPWWLRSGIAKFDKYGNILAMNREVVGGRIACIGSRVYVLGNNRILVLDENLNLLEELIPSKNVGFLLGGIAFDGKFLYVAGSDKTLGENNERIAIYSICLPTVRVVVQVVDGFGQPREWPVEVEGVVSGVGRVEAEVVEGQRYVAKAAGLGFTNTTAFTARGPQMVITIKIPTASLAALVKDGFDKVRFDWPVEIVCIAAGHGAIGLVEVLAGQYTVRVRAFGREFMQTVTLRAGEAQTVTVQVPTARLSVVVVDEGGAPVGQVESVEVKGPTSFTSTTPPRDLEVLAGQYTVKVMAFGREATAIATLSPGEVKAVRVVVPTTQSQPTAPPPPTPPPSSTDFLLVGAAAAVAAVAGALAVARLRGRGAEVRKTQPITQTVPRPRVGEGDVVGEAGDVGDFCLEYPGGVIPLSAYTVVGRRDFSGLPDRVLEMVDERHFAVYYREGVWWVEDLGSRHGTYLNGVRVKRERLREGDVVSPGAAVAAVFKRCGTTRRVVPMEEEGTKTY